MEGERVPEVTIRTRVEGRWHDVETRALFAGRTVVVFGLPGAFTPRCSGGHLPRDQELAPAFFERGVDEIVCVSVNDAYVMDAWKAHQGADDITFLPDGNGEFTRGMGMLVDKRSLGFGERSWRYSMLVRDGVVEKMFVEPERDGDPFEVSNAETMLDHLAPGMGAPPDVLLFTRPGCPFCFRAKARLEEAGLAYEEVAASPRRLRAISGRTSAPQVFIDGRHIGGSDDLDAWMNERTE